MSSRVKFISGLAVLAGLLGIILFSLYLSLIGIVSQNQPRVPAIILSSVSSSYIPEKKPGPPILITSMDFQSTGEQ